MTVPTFVNAAFQSDASATSHPITVPSGVQVDDLLLLSVETNTTIGLTISPPAGWSIIDNNRDIGGSSAPSQSLYYKIATASEVAGQTVTPTISVTSPAFVAIAAWRGISATSTLVGWAVGVNGAMAASNSVDASGITVADNDSLAVMWVSQSPSSGATGTHNVTPPSGFTEAFDSNPGVALGMEASYEVVNAGTALGTLVFTVPGTTKSVSWVAVFKPSAPIGGGGTTGQTFPHGKKGTPPTTGQTFPRGVIL